jgi:DNA-binding SARP family transcriptional activator
MTTSPRQDQSGYALHTLGDVALRGAGNLREVKLRKKDLALLVYLCVEGTGARSRVFLSSLLWGDRPQARARHSLTQAVGRLRSVLGGDEVVPRAEQIQWLGPLRCDACTLERFYSGGHSARADFTYSGDFLADFNIGAGAAEFEGWVEQRRTRYRSMALHVLEGLGTEAESCGRWSDALELGRRAVEIEAMYEAGHRRIMRALSALGERGLAINHYGEFVAWLREHVDLPPDPATSQLAHELTEGRSSNHDDPSIRGASPAEFEMAHIRRRIADTSPSLRNVAGSGRFSRLTRFVRDVGMRTTAWRKGTSNWT